MTGKCNSYLDYKRMSILLKKHDFIVFLKLANGIFAAFSIVLNMTVL